MPSAQIKSYAKKAKKSVSEVEQLWKDTKEIVGRRWKPEQDQYWALVNHIVQRRLGINEDNEFTLKKFLNEIYE